MIQAVGPAVVLFFEVGLKLIAVAVGAATPASGPPYEGPVVYEVRTASDEEIAAAAAEVPELLRRAEEASVKAQP